jgi:hypothetical protein
MSVRVRGDERALGLAGCPDSGPDGAPAVHLGAPGAAVEDGDVIWFAGPAAEAPPGARVIATSGDGLWSRAPWPANDALFELPPADTPHALIVCPDDDRRGDVLEKLAARDLPVAGAPRLTAEDLASASAVALLGDADAATPEAPLAATAMPAEAPAVLAARRVLVAPRCAVTFGLLPGSDHLAFATEDDVVQYLHAVLSFPRSFEPFATLGAIAAARHRASTVYGRLAEELRSAPRCAEPRG